MKKRFTIPLRAHTSDGFVMDRNDILILILILNLIYMKTFSSKCVNFKFNIQKVNLI
jgi:hypothetical protein